MAREFRFRLERVLDVRRLRQDAARADLARARREVEEQNRQVLRLLDAEEEEKRNLRQRRTAALDVADLRMREEYLRGLEERIRRAYEALQERVKAEIGRRRALAEAAKGVRVLERLRGRQEREHRLGVEREEQKAADDRARERNLA